MADKMQNGLKTAAHDASRGVSGIKTLQLGVWKVLLYQDLPSMEARWSTFRSSFDVLCSLVMDIFSLGPKPFISLVLAKTFLALKPSLFLYQSNQILNIIEQGYNEGRLDSSVILNAIVARVAFMTFTSIINWWHDSTMPILEHHVICYFEEYSLKAQMNTDLPTWKDASESNKFEGPLRAWYCFQEFANLLTEILSSLVLFLFVLDTTRTYEGGPLFALLCIMKPVVSVACSRYLWTKSMLYYCNNAHRLRMIALRKFRDEKYKEELVGGSLHQYIINEYMKCRKLLGDTFVTHPSQQFITSPSPFPSIIMEIIGDLPMIFYAINAIRDPQKLSLTSIALLQQSASSFREPLEHALRIISTFGRDVDAIKTIYESLKIRNQLKDGTVSYPATKGGRGMSLEVCDVSFAYPGSRSTVNALRNVSFSIKSGQLVVIVGANGSGKSTIIKLLTRLYDVSAGTILVDGRDIKEYKLEDIKQATAILAQDHTVFPLSVAENVGLGHPPSVSDMSAIIESTKLGGADHFIGKFKEGLQTTLCTDNSGYCLAAADHPIQAEWNKLPKRIDVSGGERQRLVASRTFMRLRSEDVSFVAVDEPSSALDPQGEWELFERLRASRPGKTMIFVTHRFGHLTKFADQIICLKDGTVEESGTHEELLGLEGEYARLYHVQAQAFSSEEKSI